MAAVPYAEVFDHVKIAVRERPLTEEEKPSVQVMLRTDNDKLIAFYPDSKEGLVYNYDFFYPEEATQLDVFQTIGLEMVDLVLSGYSANCISYGPSASGKTHTLFGSDQEPGLIQLATKELFHRMESAAGATVYAVKFAYWEMNCDSIIDVLAAEAKPLSVRGGKGGVHIAGLTTVDVSTWEELDELLMQGNIRRIQLSEQRNARWHGFVKLFVEYSVRAAPENKVECTMTFAHLKGSDRVGQKGARGEVMRQGSSINKSISLLGSAILHAVDFRKPAARKGLSPEEVVAQSQSFFMESKFTQVIGSCLCGGEATFLLGTVCTLDYHEATDTLENLQNAQQLSCHLKRRVTLTEEGVVKQRLDKAEAAVPATKLAAGHPLTEIEENVARLRITLGGGQVEADQTPPPVPAAAIPDGIQQWKQSVLKGKMHGDRATVYIPTTNKEKTTAAKNTYKGQWARGLKDGYGEHLTPLTKYAGYWKEGMKDGDGTLWTRKATTEPWVRIYKGSWKQDKRHGRGVNWYSNGDVYDGFFEGGQRSAIGKLFLANGDRIEGQFRGDVTDGWATLYCANNDWFEGHWARGVREGPGVWYYVSKEQCYRGEWHNNIAKHGTIEDLPTKKTNANSTFLPCVGLVDTEGVLAAQKRALDDKRMQEAQMRGETWVPPQPLDDAEDAEANEQLSW